MPTTRRRSRTRSTNVPAAGVALPEGLPQQIYGGGQAMTGGHTVRGRKSTARNRARTTTGAQHFAIPRNVANNQTITTGLANFIGVLNTLGFWHKVEMTPQAGYELGLWSFAQRT
jgi:hypothetical protein